MEITKAVIISIICSFAALAAHLALNIFRKGRQPDDPVFLELIRQAKLSLAAWLIMFILYIYLFFYPLEFVNGLASAVCRQGQLAAYGCGLILYLSLCFIYLTIYYFFDRSVSATLLEIIEDSPEAGMSCQQVKEIYSVKDKYRFELKGMREGGFIVDESGYFRNSLKGRLYARLALITKAVLKLGPGG